MEKIETFNIHIDPLTIKMGIFSITFIIIFVTKMYFLTIISITKYYLNILNTIYFFEIKVQYIVLLFKIILNYTLDHF